MVVKVLSSSEYYYYKTYGLIIASELELPELLNFEGSGMEVNRAADIRIFLGEVPESLDEALHVTRRVHINNRECILNLKNIARYYAREGVEIVVAPDNSADAGDVRLYLLGTVLGVLLHQRGDFPLHCSAIVLPKEQHVNDKDAGKKVIAFCGDSGAGKSTLLHSFTQRGYRVLGDDVGVLRSATSENLDYFYPGFPRVKLWQDALDHFNINSRTLIRDLMRTDKYHLKISRAFHEEPAPLYAVIELRRGDKCELLEQKKLNAVQILMRNTYRPNLLKKMNKHQVHFRKCAELVKHTRIFQYSRPWKLEQLPQSIDYLQEQFESWNILDSV